MCCIFQITEGPWSCHLCMELTASLLAGATLCPCRPSGFAHSPSEAAWVWGPVVRGALAQGTCLLNPTSLGAFLLPLSSPHEQVQGTVPGKVEAILGCVDGQPCPATSCLCPRTWGPRCCQLESGWRETQEMDQDMRTFIPLLAPFSVFCFTGLLF